MNGLIYLFRHGQSMAPPGLMVGLSDFELSSEGRLQAERWSRRLSTIRFTLAVSSPLLRALQTAELILGGRPDNAPLRLDPELREISLGQWEGRAKDWVLRHYPQDWEARGRDMVNHPPTGGESLADLADRVWPAFQRLALEAAEHQHTLVVAHQAVIRVILTRLPGSWPDNPLEIDLPPASLSILAVDRNGRLKCRERPSLP